METLELSNRFDDAGRLIRGQFAGTDGIENRPSNFLGRSDLLSQRVDHLVESRANGRIRDAGLFGNLFEIAAGEQKDLDKALMLRGQIGQAGRGKTAADCDAAIVTRHLTDGHGLGAIRAKIGCWHDVPWDY